MRPKRIRLGYSPHGSVAGSSGIDAYCFNEAQAYPPGIFGILAALLAFIILTDASMRPKRIRLGYSRTGMRSTGFSYRFNEAQACPPGIFGFGIGVYSSTILLQ